MKFLVYIVASLAAVSAVCSRGGGDDGMQRRLESLHRLEAQADSGDPQAMFRLARVLETGDMAMAADTARAFRLYRQAADSMYPPALNYLGFAYYTGTPVLPQDRDTAIMMIEQAAMLGDLSAAANLGWLLSSPHSGVRRDLDKAAYWLSRAAASGNPAPLESLADISMERGDTVAAEALLDNAARKGSMAASRRLLAMRADTLQRMAPLSLMERALDYYHNTGAVALAAGMMDLLVSRRSCEVMSMDEKQAVALALAITAQLHSLGMALPYDYDESLRRFYEAALMGDPSAQYIVAETLDMLPDALLPYGNTADATEWRRRASAAGITDASAALRRLMP